MLSLRNIPSKIAAISLVVIIGIHSLNTLVYTHRHLLTDGTIITHAHPFDKSSDTDPFKSHYHSTIELVFLSNLIYFLPAFILSFLGAVLLIESWLVSPIKHLNTQYAYCTHPQRGPPFFN